VDFLCECGARSTLCDVDGLRVGFDTTLEGLAKAVRWFCFMPWFSIVSASWVVVLHAHVRHAHQSEGFGHHGAGGRKNAMDVVLVLQVANAGQGAMACEENVEGNPAAACICLRRRKWD
jgi:hypothetical protein